MRLRVLRFGLAVLLGASTPVAAQAQRASAAVGPPRAPAREGDTVMVLVNEVKPERRADFERFLFEIFRPKAAGLSAADRRVFRQTRVLRPTEPNPDGTFTYLFIMDPRIPGASYDIKRYLEKMYGPQNAAEHYRLFSEALARPQSGYRVVQSKF